MRGAVVMAVSGMSSVGMRALCLAAALGLGGAGAAQAGSVRDIVRMNAERLVTSGQAPGVAVAVIEGDKAPKFFTFGEATIAVGDAPAVPFGPNMLFDLASMTKVFTTNLLGQRVASGALELNQQLADFSAQTGPLQPKAGRIRLKDLGAFTAGLSNQPPVCINGDAQGCMPSDRPSYSAYTAAELASYLQTAVPMDFSKWPYEAAKRLPAPYLYSNISVGLLGLLMGGPAGQPISNANVFGWYDAVNAEILQPLAMRNTFLIVPEAEQSRRVSGYAQATARALVSGGAVTDFQMTEAGANYSAPPQVVVSGGGGTGATATAAINPKGEVRSVTITGGGQGYVAPALVTFSNGGSTTMADAELVVANGKAIGVRVKAAGAGYQRAPTVTITGGRSAGGADAQATAYVANGQVVYVSLDAPGAGYVDPLTVTIAPGEPYMNVVTAWAPAGGLKSSIKDMAKFAAAAMGRPRDPAPEALLEGFRIAQRPQACGETIYAPALSTCPAGVPRSALAWVVAPRDDANRVPSVVSKVGGLPGFSSTIALMPKRSLAVVILVNSHSSLEEAGSAFATRTAENILYALYYERCGGKTPGSGACKSTD